MKLCYISMCFNYNIWNPHILIMIFSSAKNLYTNAAAITTASITPCQYLTNDASDNEFTLSDLSSAPVKFRKKK